MTIKQLIEGLQAEPNKERIVVMSSDPDGEVCKIFPLGPLDLGRAKWDRATPGATGLAFFGDFSEGFQNPEEEFADVEGVEALVLWPVNGG